jgi:hypothetical protein
MSDDLLIVLSRRGEVAWPTFRHYVNELRAGSDHEEPTDSVPRHEAATLRTLSSLGHVFADFSGGTGTVRISPRVLARLPVQGRPQAVLVGHRLATTEAQPGTTLQADDEDGRLPLVPRRLLVEADDSDRLEAVARAVEARYSPEPPAWRVLQFAGTVAEYQADLKWTPQRPPDWERREFDTDRVAFRDPVADPGPRDVLGEYRDPQTTVNRYYLRRSGTGIETARVDRDWGCYVVLAAAKRNIFLYTHAFEVAVPLGALLPAPYAAGLALCLGSAPREFRYDRPTWQPGPTGYLVYRGVPYALAELAATKLGQRLELAPAFEESA